MFYNNKPTKGLKNQVKALPNNIRQMIAVLEIHKVPSNSIPLNMIKTNKSEIDIYLQEFAGNNTPIAINLKDINGSTIKSVRVLYSLTWLT